MNTGRDSALNLAACWRILRKRRWQASTTFVLAATVLLFSRAGPPALYEVSALIKVTTFPRLDGELLQDEGLLAGLTERHNFKMSARGLASRIRTAGVGDNFRIAVLTSTPEEGREVIRLLSGELQRAHEAYLEQTRVNLEQIREAFSDALESLKTNEHLIGKALGVGPRRPPYNPMDLELLRSNLQDRTSALITLEREAAVLEERLALSATAEIIGERTERLSPWPDWVRRFSGAAILAFIIAVLMVALMEYVISVRAEAGICAAREDG